jgi:hypothetical protein
MSGCHEDAEWRGGGMAAGMAGNTPVNTGVKVGVTGIDGPG